MGDVTTRVALLVTCVVDVVEPEVGVAAVRLLRAAGCEVSFPAGQTCCGQPAWNGGFTADAARVARTTLEALAADGADAVVVPAGSCATMVRHGWPQVFDLVGDAEATATAREVASRTAELSEFLAGRSLPPLALPGRERVAYHHSCHLLRELRVHDQPEALLDRVDGCSRVEWPEDERCCGFGGLFSTKLPETSEAMADDKLDSLARTGASVVVSADSSCLVHLRARAEARGLPVRTRHLAEVLADALPGGGS
ncbi:MAG TPA: (Fe-S)-binding protein [Acidimicrobiales bacterium]|jgi:L-lactate dehydrogenase complex protein LldE